MSEERTVPAPVDGARRLLRRLPLLVTLLILAWLFLGNRPREIALVYDLPDDPAPTRATVRIVAEDGTVPALLQWGNGTAPAPDRQPHSAHLKPGFYRVQATLDGPGELHRQVERNLEVTKDDEQIVLHLG